MERHYIEESTALEMHKMFLNSVDFINILLQNAVDAVSFIFQNPLLDLLN